jgi:hypothetical protein
MWAVTETAHTILFYELHEEFCQYYRLLLWGGLTQSVPDFTSLRRTTWIKHELTELHYVLFWEEKFEWFTERLLVHFSTSCNVGKFSVLFLGSDTCLVLGNLVALGSESCSSCWELASDSCV